MFPQSSAMLTQLSQGYDPMFGGIRPGYSSPLQGIPGFGGGGMMGLAGMAALPFLYQQFGNMGLMPMGLGHDQNVYDSMQHQRFFAMQMQAQHLAADMDKRNFMSVVRGGAAGLGVGFGAQQQRAAEWAAGPAAAAAQGVAMWNPSLASDLGLGVSALTATTMGASRYRIDPTTGMMGMTGEAVAGQAGQLHENLFGKGSAGGMQGFRPSQAGDILSAMQARGLRGGLTGAEVDKFNLNDDVSINRLQNLDVKRSQESLKKYTGVLRAMQDIFSDMGQPNKLASDLFNSIEALTGGSMATISASKLQNVVRQTHNISQITGMPLDKLLMVQQHAEARAQQLGIESIFGVYATQQSAAFAKAYGLSGQGEHAAWGSLNQDQLMQKDANLRVQGASSNMANRLGTIRRLEATMGGFEKGSDAALLSQAVQSGQDFWTDSSGRRRSANLTDEETVSLLSGARNVSGVRSTAGAGTIRTMLADRDTNREFVDENVVNTTRKAQTQTFTNVLSDSARSSINMRLRESGVTNADALKASNQVANAVTERLMKLDRETLGDTGKRSAALGKIIGEELAKTGKDPTAGMTPEQREAFLKVTAESFTGMADRDLRQGQMNVSLQAGLQAFNPATLAEGDRISSQAQARTRRQDDLASLGHGSLLARAIDAVKDIKPGDKDAVTKALMAGLGGVYTKDIDAALQPAVEKMQKAKAEVDALDKRIDEEKDPAKKAALRSERDTKRAALRVEANSLREIGQERKLLGDTGELSQSYSLGEVARRAGHKDKGLQVDVDKMVQAYAKIVNDTKQSPIKRAEALKNFQSQYGFKLDKEGNVVDKAEWEKTEQEINERYGAKQGEPGRIVAPGTAALTGAAGGAAGGAIHMILSGTLKINGDGTTDIAGSADRNTVPPGSA